MPSNEESFFTTRWSRVLAVQGASGYVGTELAELCSAYYRPVHRYIERTSHDLGDARDLTQEFFARILRQGCIPGVAREKGRFRAYLLGAVKHYLADTRDQLRASKRGSHFVHLPLTSGTDTSPGPDYAVADDSSQEAYFDRQWGLAVLELALSALAAEHEAKGKSNYFEILKPWLTGESVRYSQTDAAAQLGQTENTVKVAIHRLRKRFRELVNAEIAQTVSTNSDLRDELRYLIEVVSLNSSRK